MAGTDYHILFTVESINKITCKNLKCKYNLARRGLGYCNLKLVTINGEGECQEKEEIHGQPEEEDE